MREIRSRISQRHGIELTAQQIQELAARRLEAILDPRTVKPSLLEQIRRGTSTPLDTSATAEPTYSFEDTTLYDSPRGSLRFIRRLLNPILKLFFNPDPLISALNAQAKLNQGAALREAGREARHQVVVNVAGNPTTTERSTGCTAIVGGVSGATVSVALVLVVVPAEFVTSTE